MANTAAKEAENYYLCLGGHEPRLNEFLCEFLILKNKRTLGTG